MLLFSLSFKYNSSRNGNFLYIISSLVLFIRNRTLSNDKGNAKHEQKYNIGQDQFTQIDAWKNDRRTDQAK